MKKIRMLSIFLCLLTLFGSFAVFATMEDSVSPYRPACPECDDRLHTRIYYFYRVIDTETHGYYRHIHKECNVCDYVTDEEKTLVRTEPHDDYPCSLCYLGYCECCMPAPTN